MLYYVIVILVIKVFIWPQYCSEKTLFCAFCGHLKLTVKLKKNYFDILLFYKRVYFFTSLNVEKKYFKVISTQYIL